MTLLRSRNNDWPPNATLLDPLGTAANAAAAAFAAGVAAVSSATAVAVACVVFAAAAPSDVACSHLLVSLEYRCSGFRVYGVGVCCFALQPTTDQRIIQARPLDIRP